MEFKIVFPSGYQIDDIFQGNIDVNIVLENGDVFFGTLFTILNIECLFAKSDESFFWSTDMVIVKDLSKMTIIKSINELISSGYLDNAFTKIGDILSLFPDLGSFDAIKGI